MVPNILPLTGHFKTIQPLVSSESPIRLLIDTVLRCSMVNTLSWARVDLRSLSEAGLVLLARGTFFYYDIIFTYGLGEKKKPNPDGSDFQTMHYLGKQILF